LGEDGGRRIRRGKEAEAKGPADAMVEARKFWSCSAETSAAARRAMEVGEGGCGSVRSEWKWEEWDDARADGGSEMFDPAATFDLTGLPAEDRGC